MSRTITLARPARRRIPRPATRLLLAAIVLLGLLLGGLWIRSLLTSTAAEATAGRDDLLRAARTLQSAGASLTEAQSAQVSSDFRAAREHFLRVHQVLNDNWLVRVAGVVPIASTQVKAAMALTDLGTHTATAGLTAATSLDAARNGDKSAAGHSAGPVEKTLLLIQALHPRLDQLSSELDAMAADRARIPSSGLAPPLARAVAQVDSKVNLPALRNGLATFRADEGGLTALLAANGRKSYLVLQQDPAELRGSGGFIGSVGFLTFDNGKMAPYDPQDIDRIDQPGGVWALGPPGTQSHVDAPYPLQSVFKLQSWELRDSNWSPDFPTSARQAEFFLDRQAHQKVDGVIAIDPYFIQRLLAIVGPIRIPETGDLVDQNNFYSITFQRVELNLKQNRKDFLSQAAKQILGRVIELPPSSYPALLEAFGWGCQTRSLQAYVHDPAAEALLDRHQCGGEVKAPPGDALMVTEANVGGNKDDFWMKRAYALQVVINHDGTARHTLRLHYDGLSDHGSLLTGRWGYTGWLRIYLPTSATVVSVAGATLDATPDAKPDLNRRVLQGWFYVQFDHATDLTVAYDVPSARTGASPRPFEFLWQKQAGQLAVPVTMNVSLTGGKPLGLIREGSTYGKGTSIVSDLAVDRVFRAG